MKSAAFLSCVLMLGIFFLPNFVAGQEAAGSATVEVTGVGKDAESALKNALYQAVAQAVGAYVDNETVWENEEVIHEKLLSVAQNFVERYEVIQPSRERRDGSGVWETRVFASVKKAEVGAALRAAGVIQAATDGTAAWAEQITRLKSREDAMEFLEKFIPEIPRNLFVCRLLEPERGDELITVEDPKSGELLTAVAIAVSVNNEWWGQEALPALNAAFDILKLRDFKPEVHEIPLQALPESEFVKILGQRSIRDGEERSYHTSPPQISGSVKIVENYCWPLIQIGPNGPTSYPRFKEYFPHFKELFSFQGLSVHPDFERWARANPYCFLAEFQSDSQVDIKPFMMPEDYADRIWRLLKDFYSVSETGLGRRDYLSNILHNLCFVSFEDGENEIVHLGGVYSECWSCASKGTGPREATNSRIFAPWLRSPDSNCLTTGMTFVLSYSIPSEIRSEIKHIHLKPGWYGVIDREGAIDTEKFELGFLGVETKTSPSGNLQVLGVIEGTAAAYAGIAPGDEIISLNGRRVEKPKDLLSAEWAGGGSAVELTIRRSWGSLEVLNITIDRKPTANELKTRRVID